MVADSSRVMMAAQQAMLPAESSWAMTAESSEPAMAARVVTSGSQVVRAESSGPALAKEALTG